MRRASVIALALALGLGSVSAADAPWEELSNEDGITVWRREVPDSDIVAFRGSGIIDAPVAKVAQVLQDTSRKLEWVANCVEARDVRKVSDFERVEYNRTGAPWPLKDRDFLFRATLEVDPRAERAIYRLRSVQDALCAPDEDVAVRGELIDSSYVLTATCGGEKTLLVVEIQADPKGSIPKWIVNLFQKSWPRKTIEGIRKQAARPDVLEADAVKRALTVQRVVAPISSLTR